MNPISYVAKLQQCPAFNELPEGKNIEVLETIQPLYDGSDEHIGACAIGITNEAHMNELLASVIDDLKDMGIESKVLNVNVLFIWECLVHLLYKLLKLLKRNQNVMRKKNRM